jgi:hypothetical protein
LISSKIITFVFSNATIFCLEQMHAGKTNNKRRYGRVICCIGVNPNKHYDVTPQTRAKILREMLDGSEAGAGCKNVQVEGMMNSLQDLEML